MRLSKILSAVLLSLVFFSCAPQPDMTAIKKAVDEFNASSIEAMKSGSVDKMMSYYEDNAVSMPPNSALLKGKDAIKGFVDHMMKSGMKINDAKFTSLEVDASGKVAYEVGEFDMKMQIPGMGSMNDKGKYLSVWKQQPDGSWKVHAEIWNTSMPAPSTEMAKKADTKKTDAKKTAAKKPATKKTTTTKK